MDLGDPYSRRTFLTIAATAVAAASCGGSSGESTPTSTSTSTTTSVTSPTTAPAATSDRREVVVIGAGMSGLAAARALHDAGHDVLVVEARERIGGRTFTTDVGPARVDLGGAWIHGPIDNPIAEFADAVGASYEPHELLPDYAFDGIDGEVASETDALRMLASGQTAVNASQAALDELGAGASVGAALDAYFETSGLVGTELRRARAAAALLVSGTGGAIDRLDADLWFNGEDTEHDGGDQVLAGGYVTMVDYLADGLDIRTASPVKRVEHGEGGAAVHLDAETVATDRVIVTVPLGVLKTGSIEFEPTLPEAKQDAIDRLEMGPYEKVVLVYAERWWSDTFESGVAYVTGDREEAIYPLFFDMTRFSGAPTLVCLYSGAFATLAQQQDGDTIVAECLDVVGEMFPDAPEPVATRATAWTTDPYSLGSYSFWPVGAEPTDRATLAAPIGDVVYFAGEATAVDYQTVHGAFTSGLREAQRIDPDAEIATS